MTDLVKLYKPSIAKGIATKRGGGVVVIKNDKAAIIDIAKHRNAPICMPVLRLTRREFIFARCDELQAQGVPYKELRRIVDCEGYARGWKNTATEISRWRHRFN